jgi:Malic enzyme, N-terminal domain
LPPVVFSQDEESKIALINFKRCSTDLDRYVYLMGLLDRNQHLFFRVVMENIEIMMPIIYTPTVGLACQNYSIITDTPRYALLSILSQIFFVSRRHSDLIFYESSFSSEEIICSHLTIKNSSQSRRKYSIFCHLFTKRPTSLFSECLFISTGKCVATHIFLGRLEPCLSMQ